MRLQLASLLTFIWKVKDTIADSRTPPVKNVWYTVLNVDGGNKLRFVTIAQENDEVADKSLNVEFTIDGVVSTITYVLPNNTMWYLYPNAQAIFNGSATFSRFDLDGHTVKIRYCIISDCGTNQVIYLNVDYSAWESV